MAKLMQQKDLQVMRALDDALKSFSVDCLANQALHPRGVCWMHGGDISSAGRGAIQPEDELAAQRLQLRVLEEDPGGDPQASPEEQEDEMERLRASVRKLEAEIRAAPPALEPGQVPFRHLRAL